MHLLLGRFQLSTYRVVEHLLSCGFHLTQASPEDGNPHPLLGGVAAGRGGSPSWEGWPQAGVGHPPGRGGRRPGWVTLLGGVAEGRGGSPSWEGWPTVEGNSKKNANHLTGVANTPTFSWHFLVTI